MDRIPIKPNTAVLVLNSSYEPIHITNWKRAIILLLKQKAQVLSDRVIRLLSYVKIPLSKIVSQKPSRNLIYKRDNHTCQYCGSTRDLTIDHIIPKSKGGENTYFNLVVACLKCNTKKGDKFLEQTDMKLLKKPKVPKNIIEFSLWGSNNPEWSLYISN
jgi:5-methylcytosine-specific restriction endonuclease McrA